MSDENNETQETSKEEFKDEALDLLKGFFGKVENNLFNAANNLSNDFQVPAKPKQEYIVCGSRTLEYLAQQVNEHFSDDKACVHLASDLIVANGNYYQVLIKFSSPEAKTIDLAEEPPAQVIEEAPATAQSISA